MKKELVFEKFVPETKAPKNAMPLKMDVGQVVERRRSPYYERILESEMRKGVKQGMEFAVANSSRKFYIKRTA